METLTVYLDTRHPIQIAFVPVHPLESTGIVPATLAIGGVLGSARFSEIGEAIIVSIAVGVIQSAFRPSSRCQRPRDTVSTSTFPVNPYPAIAQGAHPTGLIASAHLARAVVATPPHVYLPANDPGFRIITQ